MKKLVMFVCVITVLTFVSTNVMALDLSWVYSPDSTQTPGTPESVYWVDGNVVIGTPTNEGEHQNSGIYGVGAALPMEYNDVGFYISFDWVFNTWDSYNAPGTPNPPYNGGTGWWDSFSATITKGDYYWGEALTDPITTDPDIEQILVLEAGTSYGDGSLEVYTGPWTTFAYVPATSGDQYYLNLVIDTITLSDANTAYTSWGEFSDVTVNPVPEPSTMLLLGAGLIGLFGLGRKKFFKR